ncbi:unnamed protein product [Phytophthora lilii]|uniref:Unnamed protein product n=1 Tax=Phytophthora lilii TaxID=2077276 RepID=A0A9W6TFE2_9STRA|nr:unnamed protein product [Phytophthora lilii]
MPVLPHATAVRHDRYATIINLGGYQYTRAWTSRRKIVYRCSYYRGARCAGKVEFHAATMEYCNFVPHSCRARRTVPHVPRDVVEQMQIAVDKLARNDVSLSAATFWSRIDEQFCGGAQMQALTGLS